MSARLLSHPIFYDPAGRRRRWVRQAGFVFATVAGALAAIFVASVLINPWLPRLNLRQIASLPNANDTRLQAPSLVTPREQKARRAQAALRRALARRAAVSAKRPAPKVGAPPPDQVSSKPLAIGFYVNWDDSSYQSLKRGLGRLDWVVPEWIRLQTGDTPVVGEIDHRALDLIRREKPNTPIIPMIHNSREGKWDVPALTQAVGDETRRKQVINALANFVESNRFQGVCVDFEEVPAAAQPNLLRFVRELRGAFQPRGWVVTQAAPFDDSDWDYRAYAAANDYLMLMAYDEHWADSAPGSVAGQHWFEETLARRMSEIPGNRAIVCVGGYGYDWSPGRETEELTFQEAVLAARDSEAEIAFDPVTRNPYFRYREEDNSQHTVWFLDAVTAFNQMRAALNYRPAGFALWRLGSEDPSLWSVFGTDRMNADADGLREIKYGYDVDFEGGGEILQVEAEPQAGSREVTVDPSTESIAAERYTKIPSSYVIRRGGDKPGLVALTFDDGPDPAWTPRILNILKQAGVPASFFIIGQNGQANPDLVKRIVAEGHEIGNHSFTHPNLGEIPGRLTDLELNATQRLIESLTGRSTRLFRPPYFGDAEPTTSDEIEPVTRAERLGYLTVGLRVDPDDWTLPGANEIVERTIAGVTSPDPDLRGQVVLLHDGGGDRAQTVEALPGLINELRARGYKFVTVSELAGLTRDQAMPPLSPGSDFFPTADTMAFYTFAFGGWVLRWFFLIGIGLGLSRLFFIGALASWQRLRARSPQVASAGAPDQPFVSIIVPAHNEEKVIAQTIDSLLDSTYTRFEIVVVDDGSSDLTGEVVRVRYAGEARVRLFAKENGGKAEAMNYGLRHARGEIIVTLDADTVFQPDTVGSLARRFMDPKVGAVAGNAKVGNRVNLITRWQALEYITSQNLDRRAFAALNCITVVPGAVGAWRRELLERAGGFASDTLAEDQDLTLKARRMGYEIAYEENAVAWTEAPDTLKGLAKQRFRWSFGTLQCMWKHRDALFRNRYGALGWVGAPNVWVFQILFPLISPVVDLVFVWTLISAALERLEHQAEYSISNLGQVMFYYALFLAVDWLAAAFAFLLEKREQWGLLRWLFLQRFCYRQVMYYVMVKSVITALRGALVGWGKLERKATVVARTLGDGELVPCEDRHSAS
jgi:cellulose synthase/poly-beta-1,6-N-acetylglucosamine synthase-like glycosyltransferase/peptidoglycan/xylan/chitin deacetylase (PgdA/CDA1 family)/spore germination protein YaaH